MGNKPSQADKTLRKKHRVILIITLLVSAVAALVGGGMLYGYIMMRPALARSLGLLGPLTTETESPRLLEGYIYRNFEVSTFVPCEEFTGDRFGMDTYSLSSERFQIRNFVAETGRFSRQKNHLWYHCLCAFYRAALVA